MPAPDPAAFEQVAQAAIQQASQLQGIANGIAALGSRVDQILGGTATGDDKRMIGLTQDASGKIRRAVQDLNQAAQAARRAAQEAAEAQEAERRAAEAKAQAR